MMDWGNEIRSWVGWATIRQWNGWRRYGPAAGSVVAHVVVGAAIVGVMAASVKPLPVPPSPALPQPELQVTLVSETPRPQPRPAERPAPRPPRATPDADAIPDRPRPAPRKEERKPEIAEAPEVDSVFVPPSIFNDSVPLGLRNMASEDHCNPRKGLRPADCGPQWSDKVGPAQSWQLASAEELKQHYGDIIGPCRFRVGCEPGEWISTNGTRSVYSSQPNPMMGGAGGLSTGAESATSRAGLHPDHVDPGFGD